MNLRRELLVPILRRRLDAPIREEERSIVYVVRGHAWQAVASLGRKARLGFDYGLIQTVETSGTNQGQTVGLSPKLHTWACHSD